MRSWSIFLAGLIVLVVSAEVAASDPPRNYVVVGTGQIRTLWRKYDCVFGPVGSLAAGMLPCTSGLLVGPASVPVIRAVASFHGVTGREAGPPKRCY